MVPERCVYNATSVRCAYGIAVAVGLHAAGGTTAERGTPNASAKQTCCIITKRRLGFQLQKHSDNSDRRTENWKGQTARFALESLTAQTLVDMSRIYIGKDSPYQGAHGAVIARRMRCLTRWTMDRALRVQAICPEEYGKRTLTR